MRILTFNIHKGIGGLDRRYEIDRVIDLLSSFDADLLLLQEVDHGARRSGYHNQAELIANGRTVEQIEELIGADRLIYQDLHGLIRSVRHDNSDITKFDTSCFSGEYVTDDVTPDYLRALEKARSDQAKTRQNAKWTMPELTAEEDTHDAGHAVNA